MAAYRGASIARQHIAAKIIQSRFCYTLVLDKAKHPASGFSPAWQGLCQLQFFGMF